MRYFEDSLLKSNELVLGNNILNLYSALTKKTDFENIRPLNSIVYVTGKVVDEINPLVSKEIIKKLEDYMQQPILKSTIKCWNKNNLLPLVLLRVISLEDKDSNLKLSEYLSKVDKFTNYRKSSELILPKFFDELLSKDLIYFYGYLLGDGCISKDVIIKLCDGHPNKELVFYSEKYLASIQKFLKNKFNVYSKLTRIDNKYELVLVSKPLCRFFKFFYEFKKDKALFIAKPNLIKDDCQKSCIFYRGLFDADAGLKVKDKYLTFKCKDTKFLRMCISDFKNYGINVSNICYDNNGTSYFKIYSHNLLDFAKSVGFNHLRKQKDLIFHLKNGNSIKKLESVNKENLFNNYYDLRKINNLRVFGVDNIFKEYRQDIGSQQEVANTLKTYRGNIKRWENGTDSIPFEYYLKLTKLKDLYLVKVLDDLNKKEIKFGQGKIKQFIKLPLIYNEKYNKIFQYLIPKGNKVFIKSYGIDNRNLDKNKLFGEIKRLFNVKIVKDSGSNIICSNILSSFLSTFYIYKNSWDGLNDKEIEVLKGKWKL
ncbi:hypothetical protein HYV80_00945 [Candidatus Woesearchaeota archaeon]|nr:hypothetical protein [Candidatus Woesearchaeota archaeon]